MNKKYQFNKEQEERFQLEAVRQDGRSIQYIDNPLEELQIEAVRQNGLSIKYLDNPLEQLQLEAIRDYGNAIKYIDNPSEQLQLEAVRQNGNAIRFIYNPSDYIKSIVDVIETSHRDIYVLHEPNKEPLFSIGCQFNISKEYFIWRIYNMDGGLEEHPYRLEYLHILERYINKDDIFILDKNYQFSKEQEEKFQLEAVRQYGFSIEYIKNPSEEIKLEAVRDSGYAIEYIDNPSEELQIEAVRQNGLSIKYIDNPSEQVQLEAVRDSGYAIRYIDNPSSYIKSLIDIIETTYRDIYVLHEPNKEPLFSIGCQHNITKDYLIWRIYNLNGGLEENPHRQEYLDAIERY